MEQHRRWPATVWIVRHGESAANVALAAAVAENLDHISVIGRDADVPLSTFGEEQARQAGHWFAALPLNARPERVLCSPFRRARQTAELLIAEAGLKVELLTDERLREKDLGVLEKLTHQGVTHVHPQQAGLQHEIGKFYYRAPGGESWCDVISRLRSLLYGFVLHEDDRRVLFVCHQAVAVCLRYIFEHLDEQAIMQIDGEGAVGNCAISEYTVHDEAGRAKMNLVHWNLNPAAAQQVPVSDGLSTGSSAQHP